MENRLRLSMRILVSLTLCIILAARLDWTSVHVIAQSTKATWILVAFLLILLDRLLMAYKWNVLLGGIGVSISTAIALQSYFIGSFCACFLPSVGGDIVRARWVIKKIGSSGKIIASIAVERLLGALALGVVACGSFAVIALRFEQPPAAFFRILIVMLFASILGLMTLFSRTAHTAVEKLAFIVRWRRAINLMNKITAATNAFKCNPAILIRFLVLSVGEQLFPICIGYCLAKSLSVGLSVTWIALGIPLVVAISRMPVSFDGIGVVEAAYAFIFSFAGVPLTVSVMMALVARLLLVLSTLPGAFWMSFSKDSALQSAFIGNSSA